MFDVDDRDLLALGRNCCLNGNYTEALGVFRQAFQSLASEGGTAVRPEYLSHYGVAVAASGRTDEGRRFCERSIQLEPYEPEHYLNLGLVHQMAGHRSAAFGAFERGLAIRPDHPSLLAERKKLDRRRALPIPTLSREHFLNRCVAKLRSITGAHR